MSTSHARVLAACALLVFGVEAPVAVAQKSTKPFTPARLWDGKTPDFRGIWQARGRGSSLSMPLFHDCGKR